MSAEQVGEVPLREGLEPGLAGLGEGQVLARDRRGRTPSPADVIGEIPGPDHRAVRERAGALDHVLELAHVAGPGMGLEARERLGLDPVERMLAVPPVAAQEMVREQTPRPPPARGAAATRS